MIRLELKKERRTGVTLVLFITGILGALYVLLNYSIRGTSLLAMPMKPMDILLTQLYGMLMVLNVFALIVATSLVYSMEYSGAAIKKMFVLPISMRKVFMSKFLIILSMFLVSVVIQNTALLWIGKTELSKGEFEIMTLIAYTAYTFLTSLPVLSFMLMIASIFENIWVVLGVGVAGFLSGLALATSKTGLLLIHPFIVMFKPATAMTSNVNVNTIVIALIETIVFLIMGLVISQNKRIN
ncbi:MAG: ABC transporter permease [Pseudobutyrivibrio sp.]|nr:ABC transporter permease [Pseudobutyrivibrio sp.]